MKHAVVVTTAILLTPLVLMVTGAALFVAAVSSMQGGEPTGAAITDIPSELLPIYREAASTTCNLPWAVLAAIGKTESDHGRSTLPGVHSGANHAGAMGPMQFMPATWQAMGVDGDHDDVKDVYDPVDAIWGAANYLCHQGAGDPARLRAAILHYSGGDPHYVDVCLALAASYAMAGTETGAGSASIVGDYALPLDRSWFQKNPAFLTQPHHCCMPAIDIGVPVGTPMFAVTSGVAIRIDQPGGCGWGYQINGDDGSAYVYCHFSNPTAPSGASVRAGELLGYSGGTRGAAGAGNSTGAHLHFGIRRGGADYCPQPVLQAWFAGQPINPAAVATTRGCTA
jgi:hypothetical protein